MTTDEFEEAIFRLLRREPFQPFDVELSYGGSLHVGSAEAVCTNGKVATVLPENEGLIKFDHTNTVRFVHA